MRSMISRLAVVAVGATGLVGLLAASAAAQEATTAKAPKAKTKLTLVTQPFLLPTFPAPDKADALATCPERTTLLSGGVLSNTPPPIPTPNLTTEIYKSGPSGNAWFARYDNDADVNLQPSVQAICLKNRLKVKGADGKPKAISKVTQVNTTFAIPPDTAATNFGHVTFDVACPENTTIAGGGASFAATAIGTDVRLEESGPQGNGWHVRYDNDETVAQTGIASALCLKNKLKVKRLPGDDKARSKLEQVDLGVTLPANATNNGRARFNVSCPEGTSIVGGGGKISPPVLLATEIQLEESGAVDNSWQVTFDNDEDTVQSASVHALCLKNKLKVK